MLMTSHAERVVKKGGGGSRGAGECTRGRGASGTGVKCTGHLRNSGHWYGSQSEVAADHAPYAPRQSRLDLIRRSIVVRGPATAVRCCLTRGDGFFFHQMRDRLSYKSWAFSLTERANSI